MLGPKQFWILTAIASLAFVLAATNAMIFTGNRARQAEIAERQTFVQQSAQLENLYREMVKALAELSARNSDDQLTNLLANQGITVTVNQPPAAEPTPATGAPP